MTWGELFKYNLKQMFHFQLDCRIIVTSQLNFSLAVFSLAVFKYNLKQMFHFQLDCRIIATSQLNFSLAVFSLAVFEYSDSLVDL